ncbi:MAG: GNAT family N-acetyltransferase [Chloroflexi bacterium]|nr:GNAT family N-acetyltransferase [Chloroflexota bacterium]
MIDRISAAASNLADWHDASLIALGRPTRRTGALWTCEAGPGVIYLMAIPLGSRDEGHLQSEEMDAFVGRRSGDPLVVADTWDSLKLGERGFSPSPYGAVNDWYWRPPAAIAGDESLPTPGLVIERVRDAAGLKEFEDVSARGFGSEKLLESVGSFGIHAPGVLEDPRMHVFVGRVDGAAVTAAMAYVSGDVVGVYGVATAPEHRRKGFGEAITRAAAAAEPELPSWLQPSDMAAPMYRRIGYEPIGHYTSWLRPASTPAQDRDSPLSRRYPAP